MNTNFITAFTILACCGVYIQAIPVSRMIDLKDNQSVESSRFQGKVSILHRVISPLTAVLLPGLSRAPNLSLPAETSDRDTFKDGHQGGVAPTVDVNPPSPRQSSRVHFQSRLRRRSIRSTGTSTCEYMDPFCFISSLF